MFGVFLEDCADLIGLAIAFAGVLLTHIFRSDYFDGGASVLIGLLLVGVAVVLAGETSGLLVGESADPEQVAAIKEIVSCDPAVEAVNSVLSMQLGPDHVLLNISLAFRRGLTTKELESAVSRIEEAIRRQYPSARQIFLEAESLKQEHSPPLSAPRSPQQDREADVA